MKNLLILLSALFLLNCGNKSNPLEFSTVSYNSTLSKDSIFQAMDQQLEAFYPWKEDSTLKATASVSFEVIHDRDGSSYIVPEICCQAKLENDTLWVNVFSSDGYITHGVDIKIKNGKYRCMPYYADDTETSESTIRIEDQKLILNKEHFQLGDSVYGHFYVRAIADNQKKKYATGYFRTKILSSF